MLRNVLEPKRDEEMGGCSRTVSTEKATAEYNIKMDRRNIEVEDGE
jgi:hypothetical protein